MKWIQPAERKKRRKELRCGHRHYIHRLSYMCIYCLWSQRNTTLSSFFFERVEFFWKNWKGKGLPFFLMSKKGGNHLPSVTVRWHHMFSVMSRDFLPFFFFVCKTKHSYTFLHLLLLLSLLLLLLLLYFLYWSEWEALTDVHLTMCGPPCKKFGHPCFKRN